MADVNVYYKGKNIQNLDGSGKITLNTNSMFCEDNIVIKYNRPLASALPAEGFATDLYLLYFDPITYSADENFTDFAEYYYLNSAFSAIYSNLLTKDVEKQSFAKALYSANNDGSIEISIPQKEDCSFGSWMNLKFVSETDATEKKAILYSIVNDNMKFIVECVHTRDEEANTYSSKIQISTTNLATLVSYINVISFSSLEDDWHHIDTVAYSDKNGSYLIVYVDGERYAYATCQEFFLNSSKKIIFGSSASSYSEFSLPYIVKGMLTTDQINSIANFTSENDFYTYGTENLHTMEKSYFSRGKE